MGPIRTDPSACQTPSVFSLSPSPTTSSPNMKCNIIEGTYVNKKNKDFADFMIKCGCPPADAHKMMEKGMTTKFEIAKIGEKTWRAIMTCKEIPAMNDIYVIDLDKEACFEDHLMGGTNKMTMTMPNENTLNIVSDHSTMGKSEMHEVYSDQGITITTKHSSGATMTENWDRVCCDEGGYRDVGNENGEAFMQATEDASKLNFAFEDAMKGSFYTLKDLGDDCWQQTDNSMGMTISVTLPMNKEVDYDFPGWERKVLCTRISPNKVKVIAKRPDGSTYDMTRNTLANGDHMWEMNDPKKGVSCKLFYEKFTCMDGTWKPVCIEGAEEFAKAMGAGDKLAKDSANDYDQKITVKTKAGSYWTVSSDSKVFPWSVTYKLGEEFEWDMSGIPGMPEGMDLKMKCMETCVGRDKYVMIQKQMDGKVNKSVTDVTPNFMIKRDSLLGSNVCSTYIFMRC